MGHQIVKYDENKYAIFSSITDSFIIWDATSKEIISYYLEIEKIRIEQWLKEVDNKNDYDINLDIIKANNPEEYCHVKNILKKAKKYQKVSSGSLNNPDHRPTLKEGNRRDTVLVVRRGSIPPVIV